MLETLDRSRRDSTLFQFTTKQMRDFIDPNHLLIRIDEQLDFAKLVSPLEERYCPYFGRPAIHPEVLVRPLLVCFLYNIASFRRMCSAISENLAYRWFRFLTIDGLSRAAAKWAAGAAEWWTNTSETPGTASRRENTSRGRRRSLTL